MSLENFTIDNTAVALIRFTKDVPEVLAYESLSDEDIALALEALPDQEKYEKIMLLPARLFIDDKL